MITRKGQLYWDDEEVTLTHGMFAPMLDEEKNGKRYYNAVAHFSALRSLIAPDVLKDFQWIKMEYTVPYFVDLAFRCRNRVFGVMFASVGRDGILDCQSGWDERYSLCEKNDITPCLLPFDKDDNVLPLVSDKFNLVNAKRYREEGIIEAVAPELVASGDFRECSGWELENMAVMAIVENLHDKEKIDQILYQTYPGVYPNIYWIDKNNAFNWMLIKFVKERDLKPEMPQAMLEKIEGNNGYGHYGLCEISNPYAPNVYPRGQAFDLKFEIMDL